MELEGLISYTTEPLIPLIKSYRTVAKPIATLYETV